MGGAAAEQFGRALACAKVHDATAEKAFDAAFERVKASDVQKSIGGFIHEKM